MTKYFIDTNIFIYLLDNTSSFYDKAFDFVKKTTQQKDTLITSPYVMNEIHYHYAKYQSKKNADNNLKQILSLPYLQMHDIKLSNKDILAISRLCSRYNFKTFDAYHAYYCKKLRIKKIATFDKDFEKIPWLKVVH